MVGTDSYVIAKQAGHKSPDITWSSYIKRGPDPVVRHERKSNGMRFVLPSIS
jgi:hypothetical protein